MMSINLNTSWNRNISIAHHTPLALYRIEECNGKIAVALKDKEYSKHPLRMEYSKEKETGDTLQLWQKDD